MLFLTIFLKTQYFLKKKKKKKKKKNGEWKEEQDLLGYIESINATPAFNRREVFVPE